MSSLGLAKGPTQPARAARPRPWPASRVRRRIVDKARLGSLSVRRGPGGGIGRRAGFRYQWLIAVEVRVLSWAPHGPPQLFAVVRNAQKIESSARRTVRHNPFQFVGIRQ